MRINFKTHSQCVDYLIENFYKEDFVKTHTRKELAYILRIIEPHISKKNDRAFSSMCKSRMCKHVDFYLKVHMERIVYDKEWAENYIKAMRKRREQK